MSKQLFLCHNLNGVNNPVYCYHPDHLDTSNALTDANGTMYQFFLNLPFGETMASQSSTSYYQSEFKFNGKELDTETGLYYYGARYYDPSLRVWLSVDPLAEQFPSFSPYNYTMNNPINMVDPDGRAPTDTYGVDEKGNVKLYDNQKYYNNKGEEVDRLYREDSNKGIDKSSNYVESVKGKDGSSLISILSSSRQALRFETTEINGATFLTNRYISQYDNSKKEEVNAMFDFVAKNSRVEWSLIRYKDKNNKFFYQLGTLGLGATIKGQFGFPKAPTLSTPGDVVNMIHSHTDNFADMSSRLQSLWGDSWVGESYLSGGAQSYQIYFPDIDKTYSISPNGQKNANVKRIRF